MTGHDQPVGNGRSPLSAEDRRELRRQRRDRLRLQLRRRRRRAYIRSIHLLPSLATLANLICGFGAIYVATLVPWSLSDPDRAQQDPWAVFFADHRFVVACYLVFAAMLFDAVDGQLARFARHTTDFGGQLDSLSDVVSFGVAPSIIVLHAFKQDAVVLPLLLTRAVWAIAALYAATAAIRLARFNVSNEHGVEHHFSFLGLPSPGAAATVVAFVLLQQEVRAHAVFGPSGPWYWLTVILTSLLPLVLLACGLLMVSTLRYPHFTNRYLKGKRKLARLLSAVVVLLLLFVAHVYTLAAGTLIYAFFPPLQRASLRARQWLGLAPRLPGPSAPT